MVKSGQETAEIQKQLKNTQSESKVPFFPLILFSVFELTSFSKQREKQYRIQIHKLKSKLDDDN